jgi:hypothetical protein
MVDIVYTSGLMFPLSFAVLRAAPADELFDLFDPRQQTHSQAMVVIG